MKALSFRKTNIALAVVATFSTMAVLDSQDAQAAWERNSTVTDSVTDNGDGTWLYEFTVNNTSTFTPDADSDFWNGIPVIVDWELPYFADMGLSNIVSPDGWTYAIETIGVANAATGWDGVAAWQDPSDPFYAGADSPYTTATQVLHWYCDNPVLIWGGEGSCFNGSNETFGDMIGAPGTFGPSSLSGFAFTADFGPTAAPYQASWAELPVRSGDPAFPFAGGVGSPTALGTPTSGTSVPEASSLSLFGLAGLSLFGLSAMRRRKYS